MRTKVLIAGAAGRDFHNFNVVYRDRDEYDVVAFTATQIPDIAGRVYPPLLAGDLYPERDPDPARGRARRPDPRARHRRCCLLLLRRDARARDARRVEGARRRRGLPAAVAARHGAHVVEAGGRDLRGAHGVGQGQTTRRVAQLLRDDGKRVAVLRHPMPYGDLTRQVVQRFATYEDLNAADPTIEEREEYEPHLAEGNLVFAGIDYAAILEAAEQEADVIVWDVATTTRRSSGRTSTSSSSTRTGRATSSATTLARRTCGWRTPAS